MLSAILSSEMRIGIGMRWWLAALFALIAAVTAFTAGQLVSRSSEREFRHRAQQLAAGNAFEAAISIRHAAAVSNLRRPQGAARFTRAVNAIARSRRAALFVFDRDGTLMTASSSRGVDLNSIAPREEALGAALAGRRFVQTDSSVEATVIGLPIESRDSAAVLVYASHPDLRAGLGIVRGESVQAALWAVLIGALVGFVVASLIASRLRRIATAAAAIEEGRFEVGLQPRFRDELGDLALTIDRMGRHLQQSFGRIRDERDRLQALLGRLQEGVITVDRELRVEFANDQARRLLGSTLRPGTKLPGEPWRRFNLRELARHLFLAPDIVERMTSPGDDTTYLVVGLPAPASGETAVIVVTDVSERERRERAEREFVTNAAHELRTPLTTITGAIDALQSGAKEVADERDRFLAHIERESGRLRRLVRALLVLARAQTGEEAPKLSRVELRPLLREVASDIHPREGVMIEVSCPPGLTAAADADLLVQVLSNLADNAVSHTRSGRIRLSAAPANGSVLLEVSDTGEGIGQEDQRVLFDRFYRGSSRDADGFGLGLAIVREVVRALGGDVTIESEVGHGTSVRIRLARRTAHAA
jgi:signal transduction histidine kinase